MNDPDCPHCTDGVLIDRVVHTCTPVCEHPSQCPMTDPREIPCGCTTGRRFELRVAGKAINRFTSYALALYEKHQLPLNVRGEIVTIEP